MVMRLGNGWRLVLAGLDHAAIWAGLGLLVLVLLLVLYRYERRLVSFRTGLALLALRVLAALALVAALFEPVLERVWRETVRGRVVVGVDLSDSMATPDPGRTPAQRQALTALLGLSPSVDPATLARREVARRLLAGRWLDQVASRNEIEAFGFARDLVEGNRSTLAAALGKDPRPDDRTGLTTTWEPLLARAAENPATGQAPIVGVVLLSDGRANGPPAAQPALPRLKAAGIPVFPVVIGARQPPRDLAVAAVQAPESVDNGQVARVEVTLKVDGLPPGTDVPLRLERPGAEPLVQNVRVPADGARPRATFRVPMEQPGEVALTVVAGPIDQDPRPENDRRSLNITVTSDKARVLLVDWQARWEFQYLRNALVRDPRVTVESVLLAPPELAAGSAGYPTALPPPPDPPADPKQPPSPDPLGAFDLIVLGDVAPGDLPDRDWERLDRYVAQRGGTLAMAAGPRSWPEAAAGSERLRALAPVRDIRVVPVDTGEVDTTRPALPAGTSILPTPAAAGGSWPMLQFAEEVSASQAAWTGLPRLPWVLAGRPKPTATVLATATPAPVDPAPDDDTASIAAMPYGLGKVLWVGTDATWRWRFRAGDVFHHRFWGQVVQWSTRGKLAAGNRLVQFGAVPPRVEEGQTASLRARFSDLATGLRPGTLVAARVYPEPTEKPQPAAAPIAIVPLRPAPDQPRVFEAAGVTLPVGRYRVRLDVPELASSMAVEGDPPEAALEVRPGETGERIELAAAPEALEPLATATGGTLLRDDQFDRLPGLIESRSIVRTRVEPTRLWDRPEALLLFFALLTGEWILRKRAGLP